MALVRKWEYVVLLLGDLLIFAISLWLALFARYLEVPAWGFFLKHLAPFSMLFVVWVVVFFIANLYGKHTRLFKSKLPATLFYTQLVNMLLAAVFFFLIPAFGLAPKTILVLYLAISFPLIYIWRVALFPRLPRLIIGRPLRGVLIASGPDAEALGKEIASDSRYPFSFEYVIDASHAPSHEIIRQACRLVEVDEMSFLVVDFADKALAKAHPIIYDAALRKRRFSVVDVVELYQEIFDRVPLSLVQYEWVLASTSASRGYDFLKRAIDMFGALIIGVPSLIFYPFVMLAIKLDDGGPLFITQERVGKFGNPIRILKFRSMSGNDHGKYDETGKTKLKVTRAGRWLRLLRLDELPQLWNVFKGDLSLVGPRPELPALSREYSSHIPYYDARYLVAPGLTGWAQLKHDRHPHHGTNIAETKEKLSYDLYYLRHRSLLLDVFIILQTIRVVLTARGS